MTDLAQAAISGVLLGGIYCLVAIGLSLIWGIMDVVNFAHGEFMMVGMYVTLGLALGVGLDPLESLPIVVLVMALAGVLCYQLLIRRILNSPPLIGILATFGLALLLRYGIQWAFTADFHSVKSELIASSAALRWHGLFVNVVQLVALGGSIVIAVATWLLIGTSRLGKQMRAVAQDREAAAALGIDIEHVQRAAWAIGIGLTGAAGSLLALYYQVSPDVGERFTLVAFAAVALGGFGRVAKPAVAAIGLGVAEVVVGTVWRPEFQESIVFVVLIGAFIVLQPRRELA